MNMPIPDGQKLFVFNVSRSSTDVVDSVTVIHTNRTDAAFAAIRQVRRSHSIPEGTALFATRKVQS